MSLHVLRRRISVFGPLTLALLSLAACGGGGGDGSSGATSATPASSTGTAGSTPVTSSSDANVEALAFGRGTTAPVSATTGAATATSSSSGSSTTNAVLVGVSRPLSASSTVAVQGVAETPATVASTTAAAGRSFFVDSNTGNDSNDGLSATAAGAGKGPWRTLARVIASNLGPGDALRLACNSVWNETLRLPASGTAANRIIVGTPAGGCAINPVIDGSVQLPASAWTLASGNIYQATLAAAPMALTSEVDTTKAAAGTTDPAPPVWTLAHHPNRGYNAAAPGSLYLATSSASNSVMQPNGEPGSTQLNTNGDWQLPGGASLVGAGVRIRTYPWWMDESTVTAVTGRQLTLGTATRYPVGAGWGYYLVGKQWMVDSDGEWFHNPATQRLYAYMPNGRLPTGTIRATILATGIDLSRRDFVTVENLVVRRVGVGADMRYANNSVIRNSVIEDTVTYGVDVTFTTQVSIESNALTRTGLDSVSGWQHVVDGRSKDLAVRNNLIRDSGVVMNGEDLQSLPRMSLAAIMGGERSQISGNTILNAGYIGILTRPNSTIEGNFIYGACTVLDDCAGIFTQFANANVTIRGNTVVHVRNAIPGKAPEYAFGQGHGIYLDESASGVLVENNTVIDAENGVLLHVASNNIVRNNRLYANRRSQLWMQATRNTENAAGDVVNNLITGNLIAPVVPSAVGVLLESVYASTAAFGTLDGNRYFDRASSRAVMRNTSLGSLAYSFADWQSSTANDLPAGRDANGSATSNTRYASYGVTGANLVPNGNFASSTFGWATWNATAPMSQLVRETCPAGTCARFVPGGSTAMVSSQNFTVTAGQWYRLSLDVATEQEGQEVNLMVRRGGGGGNGYEMLSDRSLAFLGSRTFRRQTVVFQATTTVKYRDPATGDLGARLDIQPLEAGKTLRFANVELVPVAMDATQQVSGSFLNAGTSARTWACPFAATAPLLCSKFRRLADDSIVSWPLTVAAQSAEILYAQEPLMVDTDGDGIPDAQDSCPNTPTNTPVNAAGCPLTLR